MEYSTETQRGGRHDWTTTIVVVLATVVTNLLLYSYGYGKLDQRVTSLEMLRQEARDETRAQLTDIKHAVDQLREDIRARNGEPKK